MRFIREDPAPEVGHFHKYRASSMRKILKLRHLVHQALLLPGPSGLRPGTIDAAPGTSRCRLHWLCSCDDCTPIICPLRRSRLEKSDEVNRRPERDLGRGRLDAFHAPPGLCQNEGDTRDSADVK